MKYKCWCKATDREDNEPRYSANWVTSKRAWFKIFDNRVECGSWTIKFSDVTFAHVYRTKQMFIPCCVLQLKTTEGNYQFGFNPWATPIKHLDLELSESDIKLKYSKFSIAARIFLIVYIIYRVVTHLLKT